MDASNLVQSIRDRYKDLEIEVKTITVFTIITIHLSGDYKISVTYNSKNDSLKLQVRDVIEVYTLATMDNKLFHHRIFSTALSANVPSDIMKPLMV